MALARILTTVAVASVSALALAGCSAAADGDTPGGNADEDVTLTITTFGTFGYEDLYKQYEEENPNVTIEATNIDTGGNARTDVFTKIGAGSGLSDIVAIEEGWLGAIMPTAVRSAMAPTSARVVSATTDRHSKLRASPATANRSQSCSTATGRTTSRSARSTRIRPARPGTTTPASSGTRWSTSSTRATTRQTAS